MTIFNLEAKNIKNLSLKLEGKLSIDRDELLALVNSHGRKERVYTINKNNKEIIIESSKIKEKYDLSNLDVSQITNFDSIFRESYFDGNINSWDVSNSTSMEYMFANTKYFNSPLNKWNISNTLYIYGMFLNTKEFNQPLDNWNVSKIKSLNLLFSYAEKFNQDLNSWNISQVTSMNYIFEKAETFNQPILWDLSKVEKCYGMFYETQAFKDKFNKKKELPRDTNEIKEWLIKNRNKMTAIDIENNKGNELDNFLLNINNKDIIIN